MQYLLSLRRFDLKARSYYGSTALSAAIANGHCKVGEPLIAASTRTQEQFHVGRSLSWWVFRTGKPQMFNLVSQHTELREGPPKGDDLAKYPVFDATSVWCDARTLSITGSSVYYSCQECLSCLCGDCYKRGFRCRDQAHGLTTSSEENP